MLTEQRKIIEKVRNGDKDAFRKIVEEYRQHAFSVAFRIVCDEEEARDVVQDSFIKVWQKIGTYDMEQNFSSWLRRVIVNTAIDRLRQMRKIRLIRLEEVIPVIDRLNLASAETVLDNAENALFISWLAEGLPEKQRLVFVLRDLEGIESPEVCGILNMQETSVKSNLYHARLAIREKLQKATK